MCRTGKDGGDGDIERLNERGKWCKKGCVKGDIRGCVCGSVIGSVGREEMGRH